MNRLLLPKLSFVHAVKAPPVYTTAIASLGTGYGFNPSLRRYSFSSSHMFCPNVAARAACGPLDVLALAARAAAASGTTGFAFADFSSQCLIPILTNPLERAPAAAPRAAARAAARASSSLLSCSSHLFVVALRRLHLWLPTLKFVGPGPLAFGPKPRPSRPQPRPRASVPLPSSPSKAPFIKGGSSSSD